MWIQAKQARIDEIAAELKRICNNPTITKKMGAHIDALCDEGEALMAERDTYKKGLQWSGAASPYPSGNPADAPVGGFPLPRTKSAGTNAGYGHSEPKWQPPSPLHTGQVELKNMFEAARRKQSYRVEVGGIATKNISNYGVKSAISESGMGGMPPVVQPQLTLDLPYEPDRFWSHLPGITADVPALEFYAHDSNAQPAQVTPELGTKVDVGMNVSPHIITPVKITALASVSMEALSDFEYFAGFVPNELSRALINAETNLTINGGTAGGPTGMNGVLAASGVLTRAMGSDTPLDSLQLAFNDLRVGPAFAVADLVVMHPTTWSALRRQKTTFDSYILAPDPSTGQVSSLWGVTVIANTMVPAGTAIVLDTTKSLLAWTRWGMFVESNPWGSPEWETNAVSFRCEERIGLGVRRASAICVVTGLPAS